MHLRKRIVLAAVLVLVASLIYAYLVHYSLTVPLDSDDANYMLLAQSMAHGNLLLRGWLLPPDPYWLTDLALYAPVVKLLGASPIVSHAAASLVYLLLCAVAAALVVRGPRQDHRAARLGLLLLPLLALPPLLATTGLVGPRHVGTMVVALLVLLLWPEAGRPATRGRTVASFALLYIANLSDPFTLWIYTAPLLATALLAALLRRRADWRRLWPPLLVALLAGALAVVTKPLLMSLGDVRTYGLAVSLTRSLGGSLHLLVQGFPMLYGVSFAGGPPDWLVGAAHLLIFIAALLLVLIVPLRWAMRGRGDLPAVVLSISTLSVLAEFVLSSMATNLASLRYLLPSLVFSLLVLAREIDLARVRARVRRWLPAGAQRIAGLTVGILLLFPGVGSLWAPGVATPWPRITAWLEQHHLSHGYGPYWDASILSLYSGGRVTVRALTAADVPRRGIVDVPYLWFVEPNWYDKDVGARFVIYDPADYGDVQRSTITATFGLPASEHRIGKYTILVWRHPIYAAAP